MIGATTVHSRLSLGAVFPSGVHSQGLASRSSEFRASAAYQSEHQILCHNGAVLYSPGARLLRRNHNQDGCMIEDLEIGIGSVAREILAPKCQ
jgi:hypothetical protein